MIFALQTKNAPVLLVRQETKRSSFFVNEDFDKRYIFGAKFRTKSFHQKSYSISGDEGIYRIQLNHYAFLVPIF